MQIEPPYRRKKAKVSVLGTTQMHLRNPWVIALWSAIFPGMGHLLLSKYISGFILFVWEIIVNLQSHLNLAIYYSFIGKVEEAEKVLDKRWLILYFPVFVFAIWDSYRTTVDMNNNFELACREDAEVKPFTLNALGFNYLDKSPPWVNLLWSCLSPGTGQLAIHRIMVAFFIIPWWITAVYFSKLLLAIHYTAVFNFDAAIEVLDKQWFINFPSLLFFPIYDAYANTVESNKLYEWELAKFLKHQYQNQYFIMPIEGTLVEGNDMYVVSNFEYSINIEKAVAELQMKGIPKESILAVPLDKRNEDKKLFDSIHYSDSYSMFDLAFILAALFALFGAIYGFLLIWGPIIWALLGTGFGFGVGVVVKLIFRKKQNRKKANKAAEVVLIISCKDTQLEQVNNILWDNGALGTSKLAIN
jgi:hypothetical protein